MQLRALLLSLSLGGTLHMLLWFTLWFELWRSRLCVEVPCALRLLGLQGLLCLAVAQQSERVI